jgi:uncharacterized protein
MDKPLIDFAVRLRQSGLKVSPAEILDATATLSCFNLADRAVFKDALRSTLIKRCRDIPVFDSLFELHFGGGSKSGAAPDESEKRPLDRLREHLANKNQSSGTAMSRVTRLILSGRFGDLTKLMIENSHNLGMDRLAVYPIRGTFFLNRLRRKMELDNVAEQTEQLLAEMMEQGLHDDEAQAVRQYVQRNLDRLHKTVEALVDRQVANKRFVTLRRLEEDELANRNLFQLSEQDILAMRPSVERLALRLKDRLSMRYRRAESGRFDIKTTLRKNVGFGGPLPDLRFRNKNPARPQVVTLCDVSRSVRNFSRFMLLFLYTLKEVVSRVRSFIFVGDIAEVTLLFQQYDLNEAVAMAAEGHGLTYPVGTDYGSCLTQFCEENLTSINSKTTVIVLGDARNNNLPPRLEALQAIAGRAKKLIWLNPESHLNWRLGDSVMELYKPFCTTVAECGNLKQLSAVIEENLMP